MKKALELVLCIFHPIAVILIWAGMFVRKELGVVAKITWSVAAIVPFVLVILVLAFYPQFLLKRSEPTVSGSQNPYVTTVASR